MNRPRPLRHRFSRRSLLRGLGAGAALLAPFVRRRASMAQSAPAGNLLIFYTPNGHRRNLVFNDPTSRLCFGATSAAGELTLGSSLMPLQPFRRDVAVIKGLNLKTPTFIASHQDICRILTCWSAPREGNDLGQFAAFGPSIDQVIGKSLNQQPLIVAVDPFRPVPHWRTFLSWSASGVNAPFVKDHERVFTDLFGGLPGVSQKGDQLATLARLRLRNTSDDRAHLGALRSIEKRLMQAPTLPPPGCAPNDLQPRIAALPVTAPPQIDDKSPDGFAAEMQARGELWMDMIATAFACGTRRVAVIQWQCASEGYDPVGNTGSPNHHSVTEGSLGAASGERWAAIDTWYANRFAYQLAALENLGVLDRTIVAWVSEISEAHNQCDMVTIVAGGRTLGMKTGQYIQYPFTGQDIDGQASILVAQDPANRSLSDLWVTIQQALGVDEPTFGDPKWCAGPLTELRA
jgi:hypothetical protein